MQNVITTSNGDTLNVIVHNAPAGKTASGPDYLFWGMALLLVLAVLWIIITKWKPLRAIGKKIKPSQYQISIGGFQISGNVEYYTADQQIAWKIYVEMATRITANELKGDGILREAIASIYTVFGVLRETLKNAPLDVARPPATGKMTVSSVLLIVMNEHMRPFLSRWHPLLKQHEDSRAENVSPVEHEKKWAMNTQCRGDLTALSAGLNQYVAALKSIAEGQTK
jgi:hypothetical protein